jgi:hypothetical protein
MKSACVTHGDVCVCVCVCVYVCVCVGCLCTYVCWCQSAELKRTKENSVSDNSDLPQCSILLLLTKLN